MKTTVKCLIAAIMLSIMMPAALLASDWTPIYEGVEYQAATKTSPRTMHAYALRIDLYNPYVSFYATPSNGGAAYETTMQTTPTFRSTYGLEAAINANFFVSHSPNADVQGLLISNGTTVSLDQAYRQAQLRLTSDKVATITGSGGNPSGIHTAVAGDAYHLVGGVALGDNSTADPRTSVGISKDGQYLIMCVVDGRGAGGSQGATILDMSHWMLDFGAWNAINLDGGGSSCICTASGGVLNNPSDGSPRSVGANLGVNTSAITANTVWPQGPVARGSDSRLMIWAADSGGAPSRCTQSDPNSSSWGSWTYMSGNINQAFTSTVTAGDGALQTFVHSNTSGGLKTIKSPWSAWVDLGGNVQGGPAAIKCKDGRLIVFIRSATTPGQIAYRMETGSGTNSFGNWYNLGSGGVTALDPVVARQPNGRVIVFIATTTGDLKYSYQTADNSTSFSAWQSMSATGQNYKPAVAINSNGKLQVFVRGSNGALKSRLQGTVNSPTSWGSWVDHGGNLAGGPAAARSDDGRIHVSVISATTPGTVVERVQASANSTTWGNWINLDGNCASDPWYGYNDNGLLTLFVKSATTPGTIAVRRQTNRDDWGGWVNLNGPN